MSIIISHLRRLNLVENLIKRYCARQAMPFIMYQEKVPRSFVRCSGLFEDKKIDCYVSGERLLEKYGMQDTQFSVQQMGEKFLSSLYSGLLADLEPGAEWFLIPPEEIVIQELDCTISSERKLYSAGNNMGVIWFDETALASLTLPAARTDTDWSNLLCPVKISLGFTTLKLNDIHHLNAGDVLWLINEYIALYVGDKRFCSVCYEQDHFSVSEDIMDDLISNVSIDDLWSEDGLRLNIEFVVSETSMTLADIGEMQPGDVLDSFMGIDDNKITVQLRVQGKTIATGELVLLNERMAVEIEKVYGTA